MKHTPGPWKNDNTWEYYDGHIIRHNGVIIARILRSQEKFPEENDANALLIAAAPDMLWMLKDILDFLKRSGYDTRMVKAVIAKAEGK